MKATYKDHMGGDLSAVNAARVSFGKESEVLTKGDEGLIQFLARGCTSGDWEAHVDRLQGIIDREAIEDVLRYVKRMPDHWTPFGHTAITLHMKAPIFIARQLGKHQVGMVWNEVSRRYVDDEPEFYVPQVWRGRSADKKQGSEGEVKLGTLDDAIVSDSPYEALCAYKALLKAGVAPEQARMVLPQSMFTEWYWTGNLYAFSNVFVQRTDSHAQRECQDIAHQIGTIIEPLFPVSWKALTS